MSARLGFAIMAHVDADIIITDEALAVGDVFFVQKCMRFIRSFLKKGTFLFVSHSTNDVLSLCQNAVWLDKGHIKAIGSAASVTRAYLDEEAVSATHDFSLDEKSNPAPTESYEIVKAEVVLGQPVLSRLMDYKAPKHPKDARSTYLNQTPLRNDIQIPSFDPSSQGITKSGAKIMAATFCDETGTPFSWMVGGEMATLRIEVLAEKELKSPMVGFQVIDRLGQVLFADNTYLVTQEHPVTVKAETPFAAEFRFQLPLLPVGDYVIRAAVAVGEAEGSAVLLHTLDNAVVLRSVTSGARHGLIGVPMHSIKLCSNPEATLTTSQSHTSPQSSPS